MGTERCFWKDLPMKGPLNREAPGLRGQRSCLWIVGEGVWAAGPEDLGKTGCHSAPSRATGLLEGVEVGGTSGCAPLGSAGHPSIEGCGLPAPASDGTLALPCQSVSLWTRHQAFLGLSHFICKMG